MTKNIKYRIIARNSDDFPYGLERKVGFFGIWKNVSIYVTISGAEYDIASQHKKFINSNRPKPGTVMKEYSSEDLSIIILKD